MTQTTEAPAENGTTNGTETVGEQAVPKTVLDRIKKLLERASANIHVGPEATEAQAAGAAEEAARAMELASEMLTRYNLTADTVLKAGDPRREIIEDPWEYTKAGTPSKAANEWLVLVAIGVAEANFCRILVGKRNIYWVGRRENVDVAKELMQWILPQFGRLTAASMQWVTEWKDRPRFRRSYRMGLAKQVALRLHTMRQRQAAGQRLNLKEGQHFGELEAKVNETTGKQVQALVLRRQNENDTYVEQKYPQIKQREASKAQLDAFAQALGWEDGKSVTLISQARQIDQAHGGLVAMAAETTGAEVEAEAEAEEEAIPGVVTTPLRDSDEASDERAEAEAAQAEAEASQEPATAGA
jgi:hypothetical protein